MTPAQIFKNRSDAGQKLAKKLLKYKAEHPLILALPRGGVPVAYEVARFLGSPLDTVAAKKIGAPFNPEFGVGAIAPGDVVMINNTSLESVGVKKEDLDPIIEQELREMERRISKYQSGKYSSGVEADTVIIIDDGLATGVTARAAIESVLIIQKPLKIVFACPICARDTVNELKSIVDVVFVQQVDNLQSVGQWYEEFKQVTDEEVVRFLKSANSKRRR